MVSRVAILANCHVYGARIGVCIKNIAFEPYMLALHIYIDLRDCGTFFAITYNSTKKLDYYL